VSRQVRTRLVLCGLLVGALTGGPAHAGTVSGQVLAFPGGEGLPGVQVLARDPQGASAAAVTDADGRYVIDDVDSGDVRIQARPPDTMNRLGAYAGDVSAFCAADTHRLDDAVDGVQIELPQGGAIAGVLADADGAPAAGLVTAVGVDTLNVGLTRRAEASLDGSYSVLGLASWISGAGEVLPGAYRVSAALDGEPAFYSPGVWGAEDADLVPAVREQETSLDLVRPAGARLTGRVSGPGGEPVPAATIAVVASGFGVVWTGVTDGDGEWAADDVPGHGLAVRVRVPGFAEVWSGGGWGRTGVTTYAGGGDWDTGTLVPAAARSVEIVLAGSSDAYTGGATLTLQGDAPLRTEMVSFVDGAASVEGLPPIELSAVIGIEGWLDTSVSMAQGVLAISASPEPAVTTFVVVSDRTEDRTLRGALVEAVEPETGAVIGAGRTDGEGNAVIRELPQTDVLLRASWQPFCPGDRALVTVWSGNARSAPFASAERTGLPTSVRFALPPDGDADGMDDVWELLFGLDVRRNDGGSDPDGDGASSLDEYLTYGDPLVREGQTFSCSQGGTDPTCAAVASSLLLLLVLGGVVRRDAGR